MKKTSLHLLLLLALCSGCNLTGAPKGPVPAPEQVATGPESEDKAVAGVAPNQPGGEVRVTQAAAGGEAAPEAAAGQDNEAPAAADEAAADVPKADVFSPAHKNAQEKIGVDPEEALKSYQAILASEPTSEAALRNVALLLQNKGDFAGAEKTLRTLIAAHPDNEWAYNTLIVLLREQDNIQGAQKILTEALKILPEGLQLLNQKAAIRISIGDLEGGEQIALSILKKDEKNTMAMLNLGNIYYKQQKYELASFAADNVINIDPNNAAAYNLKAFVRWQAGATQEALYFLKEASSLQPDNPTILLNTAQLLRTEGDAERGLELIKRAYEMRPNDPNIILELGNSYRFTGDYLKALEFYRLVQEKDPSNVEVVYNLGLLYFDNDVEDLTLIPKMTRSMEYLNAYLDIAELTTAERKLVEGYVELAAKNIAQEEKRLERVRKRQEREARLKAEAEAERKAQEEAAAAAREDGGDGQNIEPQNEE